MKIIKLSNGVEVPVFGLGTFKVEPGQSAYETVLEAFKIGYRHIDTAQMYQNEADIGQAIADSKLLRSEIFVTTKQKNHHEGNTALIKAEIMDSIKKLQVEAVDLLLIHWPHHNPEMNAKTWSVLEEIYNEGKARAIGVSNFNIHHLMNLAKTAKIMPMMNQVELHPGLQQEPLKRYCESLGIVITSYGPFMKGKVYDDGFKEVLEEIAKEHNSSIAQVIIAWGLARGVIMIPKTVNSTRLKENFMGQELMLTNDQMEMISKLNRGLRVYTDPDNNAFYPF